jgi:dihydrodipicolinate synthase/N-acetylneuraminate lyase
MPVLIDGIHIPLTTPFTRDGALYLRKLEYNVGRYSLTPAAGLVALTGEGAFLSDEEALDSLRVIGATADPEKVLIAAISKGSVRSALSLAEQADEAGFDAILLSAPPDAPFLTPSERLLFFQAVADASPLPVLLWSNAIDPGTALPIERLTQLSRHGNVLGLYEAGLTVARYRQIAEATREARHEVKVTTIFAPVTRRMVAAADAGSVVTAAALAGGTTVLVAPASSGLKTRTRTVGFQIMAAASATRLVDLLDAGVAGAMPSLAASAPQACYEAYAAFKDGDPALASEKEQRLAEADRLMAGLGIAGIKYGCDLNGYFGGAVRLPRLPLDASQKANVERVLSGLRN